MLPEAFRFNSQISYPVKTYSYSDAERQNIKTLLLHPTIYVESQKASFSTKFLDISNNYILPMIKSDALVSSWSSNPKKFWQNQLNFAVWCATTGCGVSVKDHLMSPNTMLQSFYRFHVYFQTRKILNQLRCPLPTEATFSVFENSMDLTMYDRLCNEFGVSSDYSDFRQKASENNGIGTVYIWPGNQLYHNTV